MRAFTTGGGRIHALAYWPDGKTIVVDSRDAATGHPWMGFDYLPAHELAWWDWMSGTMTRRFRLRDSLYGPGGACVDEEEPREDWNPDGAAFDVAWIASPLRVATAWEWTNKEDGLCLFEPDGRTVIDLRTPYKAHFMRLAIAPDGSAVAAVTVGNMDGLSHFETWVPVPGSDPVGADRPDLSPREITSRCRYRELQVSCINPFHTPPVLAFDGRFVAAAGSDQAGVLLWDAGNKPPYREWADTPEDWESLHGLTAPTHDVGFVSRCLAFAPGRPLLAAGGAGLVFHDLTSAWLACERDGPAINAITFSLDGRMLLAATEGGTAELWDVASRRMVRAFDWRRGPLTATAFAPDGGTCAVGTDAGDVIVWDREE